MPLPVYTAEGGGLFWLIVLFMIGGQISKLFNKGGKDLPKAPPASAGPDIEEFLRKLAQGENPLEELAKKEQPQPPKPVQTAPPPVHRQPPPVVAKRETVRTRSEARSTPPARTKREQPPRVPHQSPVKASRPTPPPSAPAAPRRPTHSSSRTERTAVHVATRAAAPVIHRSKGIMGLLKRKDTLRSAILLREILGPPTSAIRR